MYESWVCWRSSRSPCLRQHNQNDVLVSRSRRAGDVTGITRECLYVTIGPLCLWVAYYTQTLVTKNPLCRHSCNKFLCLCANARSNMRVIDDRVDWMSWCHRWGCRIRSGRRVRRRATRSTALCSRRSNRWCQSQPFSSSSSSSLARPVIWGRRYSWWSYSSVRPCLLRCPLSAPPLSYLP